MAKILVVDDQDTIRVVITHLLKTAGYQVIEATRGEQTLRLCEEWHPDLVILDVHLPDVNGIEVCRRARQAASGSLKHIILLTARGEKADLVEGFAAGANDYITKNFDPDELKARVGVGARIVELQLALANRVKELEDAMSHIKKLQGILPICMHCHKIRDDGEVWQKLEEYILDHTTDVTLSHGLCPECLEKYYSEYTIKKPPKPTS